MRFLSFYSQSTKLFMYFGKVQILIYIVGKTIFSVKTCQKSQQENAKILKKCFREGIVWRTIPWFFLMNRMQIRLFSKRVPKFELISLNFFSYSNKSHVFSPETFQFYIFYFAMVLIREKFVPFAQINLCTVCRIVRKVNVVGRNLSFLSEKIYFAMFLGNQSAQNCITLPDS